MPLPFQEKQRLMRERNATKAQAAAELNENNTISPPLLSSTPGYENQDPDAHLKNSLDSNYMLMACGQ